MTAEQMPGEDPTARAIAMVAETMQGVTTAAGDPHSAMDAASAEELPPPPRGRLEMPDRPQYSNSDSAARYSGDRSKNYSHNIWAPDKRADGTEEPGHLTVTAYLDQKGFIDTGGNAYDRYHYRTAADLANLAQMGFAPVMEYLGIITGVRVSELYYNRYCNIRVDFPSADVFRERANALLARHAEANGIEPMRFIGTGRGRYTSELYLESIIRREYLLASEDGTPERELDRLDEGTHDVLTHALAVVLMAGTGAPDCMQHEGQKTQEWVGQATQERFGRGTLGSYMRRADRGLSLPAFVGALRGEEKGLRDFRSLFGQQASILLEQIRKNATAPQETGLWVP